MFNNRRPYKVNHIPNKLNYINKNRNLYDLLIKVPYYRNYGIGGSDDLFVGTILAKDDREIFFTEGDKEVVVSKKETFEEKFERLEQQEIEFFQASVEMKDNLNIISNFLYHGIRFQKHLEKLENIFMCGGILAGNYQEDYYPYSDNCNEGEYVSLTDIKDDYDLEYQTFVMPNISLVISSECNAIKTVYLRYEEWEQIRGRDTKNRYSYARNEYHVKKMIPIEMVKAIGLPAKFLKLIGKGYLVEVYKNDILALMERYNIGLPIIDTSDYNRVLVLSKNYMDNYIKKKKKIKKYEF